MGHTITVEYDFIKAVVAELRISNTKPAMALANTLEAAAGNSPKGSPPALFGHYETMAVDAALARFGINSFLSEFSTDKDVREAVATLCNVVREKISAPEAPTDVTD